MARKVFIFILVLFGCVVFYQPLVFAAQATPVDLGQPPLGVNDMIVVNGTVYVANSDGLVIFEVANPTERQTIPIDGGAKKVLVAGGYAYLVDGNDELVVINLGDHETGNTQTVSNLPHFDSIHMELTIPEVDIDGTTYKVIMKQRGASNNFEVTSATPVTTKQTLSH
jgi:hypothetical protein